MTTVKSTVILGKKGRPGKLTPETIETLVDMVRDGNPFVTACEAAGINKDTRINWMRDAKKRLDDASQFVSLHPDKEDEIYRAVSKHLEVQLFLETIKAEADYKKTLLKRVKKQSKRDWKAAAWLLAKRWPNEFGEKAQLEITGADGEPVKQEIKLVFEPRELTQALAILS